MYMYTRNTSQELYNALAIFKMSTFKSHLHVLAPTYPTEEPNLSDISGYYCHY
jgi:hypothetical protein